MSTHVSTMHSIHPDKKSGRWTDDGLKAMRKVTDPPADAIIAEFFAAEEGVEPHELLIQILDHRLHRPKDDLVSVPARLLKALDERDPVPPLPDVDLGPGQRLLRDHGPEIFVMLGAYSLPMSYAAANGAHVLAQTGYLEHRVMRRTIETAQLILDVLKVGGLQPGGDGIRSAREVRLLHAAIRYLIKHTGTWDVDVLGEPINQEDMAGTLMVFCAVVIDGFQKIGIDITVETKDSFLANWAYIGTVMGLHPDLIPHNADQAREMTWMIYDQQMACSDVGRELMAALLDVNTKTLPFGIARLLTASIVRIFMMPEAADVLGVPRHRILDFSMKMLVKLFAKIDNVFHRHKWGLHMSRWFSRQVIHVMMKMGRGHDKLATFDIPLELQAEWRLQALPDAMR